MNSRTIRTQDQIPAALQWAADAARRGLESGKPVVVRVTRETRKSELNALMWVKLTDCEQIEHHGERYVKEVWKVIMLTAFRNEQRRQQRWIIGLDGQPVEIGGTSNMTNAEIRDFIAFIEAEGTARGVRWSAPKRYE